MLLAWILGFSLLGSLGAVGGAALLLVFPDEVRRRLVPALVAYAAGTLLGAAFLGMIPAAAGHAPVRAVSAAVLAGIVLFFVLERLVLWRHGHEAGSGRRPAARPAPPPVRGLAPARADPGGHRHHRGVSFLTMSAPAKIALALLLGACVTLAAPAAAQAQRPVELAFFYGRGCPHCANMKEFLQSMQAKYPQLRVLEREVYFDAGNARLFERVAAGYGVPIEGVPTVFVGGRVIGGFSEEMAARVEQGIRECVARGCASPLARATAGPANTGLTLSAVAAGAAVDAINPCAFAVLIILISAILASGGRRRALYAGTAFSLSIFISYYLMGLGLYSAVQAAAATRTIYLGAAILALVVGLFNLKDYLWYGKWFAMEVPQSWRPALKRLIQGVTSVPGAFLVGFAVSLFLLPCTSGPYIVILGLLAKTTTRASAMLWLLLYNAIFILPMVLITGAVYYRFTTAEKVEAWRAARLPRLHLVAGIVLLLLGLAMMASLWLGAV